MCTGQQWFRTGCGLTSFGLQVLARFPGAFDGLIGQEHACLVQGADHNVLAVLQLRPQGLETEEERGRDWSMSPRRVRVGGEERIVWDSHAMLLLD